MPDTSGRSSITGVKEGLIMAILEEPIKGVPKIKNYVDGEWVESKGEVMNVVT